MTSYIRFEQVPNPGRRTGVYTVISRDYDNTLGIIKWHGPWRQYVFWPRPNTLWSIGCLEEINQFIAELMESRRIERMRAPCPNCGHLMTTNGASWLCVGCGAIRLRADHAALNTTAQNSKPLPAEGNTGLQSEGV